MVEFLLGFLTCLGVILLISGEDLNYLPQLGGAICLVTVITLASHLVEIYA